VGILLFSLLTAWDAQRIKNEAYALSAYQNDHDALARFKILNAFSMYLNFVNIFIYLLRLLGSRRED
jgi:FtsH-binding integral membrane protein